ncbi:acyltransferase family protein [Pseudoduganella lutea]|uniref:Acyltransferase n=1 Tax=Pseudoduganella lutea TaxID=321985 RepID=A0A4V0Z3A5_9BURK|nr:acyltransferase [Pseudoduganella lutea]QBE62763.1 acyltransferase [Pseudoduganella lutea]
MKSHIPELDLLRFGAAISVMLFHLAFRGAAADGFSPLYYEPLAAPMKYGYLGVDLFFMISGFVIMVSAQSGSIVNFISSRLSRLYPAFWICCSITFCIILLSETTLYPAKTSAWLFNMTMMPGSFGVPFLDGSYWSLGIEIKFYVLIACIIAIGQIQRAEWFMYAWLAAAVMNIAVPIPFLVSKLILTYAPCFIAGALFYFVRQKGSTPLRWTGIAVAWILMLQRGVDMAGEQTAHYGVAHSAVVICFTLTAFFAMFTAISLQKTGSLAKAKWPLLGALTYPLYLLHQTIGYIIFSKLHDALNEHLLFWGTVALSFGAAYVVTLIEAPLIRTMRNGLSKILEPVAKLAGLGTKVSPT